MKQDMGELLDHVPALVKAYGRWPSYLVILLCTPSFRGVLAASGALFALVLYRRL